jgi:hypothetical protein
VALSHVPCWYDDGNWDINVHGHIHNNGYNPAIRDGGYGDRNYRNICVEQIGYQPVRLRDVCLGKEGTNPQTDGWNETDPDDRLVITKPCTLCDGQGIISVSQLHKTCQTCKGAGKVIIDQN